jgi:hypothetical protein
VRFDDLQRAAASIAGIGTQVLATPRARGLAPDHDDLQHPIDLRDNHIATAIIAFRKVKLTVNIIYG